MRELILQKLKESLRKKWFWIGVILAFIIAIAVDTVLIVTFVLTQFINEKWHPYLLAIGIASSILGAFAAKNKFLENKNLREIGKLLFLIALIWAFKDYGFINMLIFMAGILITTRVLKWFTPKKVQYNR